MLPRIYYGRYCEKVMEDIIDGLTGLDAVNKLPPLVWQ